MGFLTINLDMTGREALLIGAGRVGRRKLADLLKVGAKVRVVEPHPDDEIRDLARQGVIRLEKELSESFLDLKPVIFVAADDPGVGSRLSALAKARGLLINVADKPSECDFYMPAVADLSPLRLAVTTDGASPALAALIAAELRALYRGHGLLAAMLAKVRPAVLSSDLGEGERRRILTSLAEEPRLPVMLAKGEDGRARELVIDLLGSVRPPVDFLPPGGDD